jgi:hypothetical protein
MTTVLEALQNAQINLTTVSETGAVDNPLFEVARQQLANVIKALEDGYQPHEVLHNHMQWLGD